MELSDLFSGLVHNVETVGESLNLIVNSGGLVAQELQVELNQLEEGCRSGVVVTSLLDAESSVSFSDGHVDESHVLGNLVFKFLVRNSGNFLEEFLGDTN